MSEPTSKTAPIVSNSRRHPGARDVASYLEYEKRPPMSPLGQNVADLLGELYYGIYHMDESRLMKADWSNPRWISVVIDRELATFDGADLTHLVLLAHERCVRVAVRGRSKGYLELLFTPRAREGCMSQRHPTIEVAIENYRGYFGPLNPSEAIEAAQTAPDAATKEA